MLRSDDETGTPAISPTCPEGWIFETLEKIRSVFEDLDSDLDEISKLCNHKGILIKLELDDCSNWKDPTQTSCSIIEVMTSFDNAFNSCKDWVKNVSQVSKTANTDVIDLINTAMERKKTHFLFLRKVIYESELHLLFVFLRRAETFAHHQHKAASAGFLFHPFVREMPTEDGSITRSENAFVMVCSPKIMAGFYKVRCIYLTWLQ